MANYYENLRNEIIYRLVNLLVKETNSDIHKSVNYTQIYDKAFTEINPVDGQFDLSYLNLRDSVREHAIDKNLIQNDINDPEKVRLTEEGIKENERTQQPE